MKTKLTFLVLLFSVTAFANDEKYIGQMTKHIEAIYQAETTEEFQRAINAFERIGNSEKTKWEPFYYSSYGYIMLATREQDGGKKDAYLDLARQLLDKAVVLLPGNSELTALEGFIHMIRVTVDPATRGPQYSMMAMQSFGKAVSLDSTNPRALSLLAQMQFGTAQFFNQKPTEACANANKALVLFSEAGKSSQNPLLPNWGKGMTVAMVKNCQ